MTETIQKNGRQTIISYLILLLLIIIAFAIGLKQQSYQKFNPNADSQDTSGSVKAILNDSLFGDKFAAMGNIENYNPTNLYEKIDGKADLYLNNGFVSLQCRRFAEKTNKDAWAEVYLYDMGNGENAFAVYSMQKRSESVPLDWAQFGYSTSDALYTAAGRYYIEVSLAVEDTALLATASSAVKNMIPVISSGKTEIPFLGFFPKENLVAGSFKFISADAFGCGDMKNIFAAEYSIDGNNITAYLSKDAAGKTYKNYYRFLIDNGGTELQHDIKLPDGKAVELFGTTDIIFRTGDYFAGVRGSASVNDLKQVADKLIESLSTQK